MTRPAGARMVRSAAVATALLTLVVAARLGGIMWHEAVRDQGFQMFDNNEHALAGAQMAADLREGEVGRFLARVNDRTVWPPLLPLLEVPGFLLFGADYDTAERQMVVFGVLTLLAAAVFGFAPGGVRGVVAAGTLVALVATSPFFASFMTEIMTEGPAALLWLVSMTFYVRWVRHARGRDAALCCLFGFGLFMLKFNFGVLWALPLLLYEPWRAGLRPATLAAGWRTRPRVHPLWLAYGVVVGATAIVVLARLLDRGWGAGGMAFGVAQAGTHGLRTAVLAVIGLAALPFLVHARATARSVGRLWRAAGPFGRAFVAFVCLPTALWFAVPSHAKGLLHFIAGRAPEMPLWSAESLRFYPRLFVHEYSPDPLLGVAVALLAGMTFTLWHRLAPAERILPVALAVQVALVTLHAVKGDRYFYTVAFVVWAAAALALAVVAEGLARRFGRGHVAAFLAPVLLLWALAAGPDLARVRADAALIHAPPAVGEVLDAIADVHAESRGSVLLGTWNRLAPPLVEWHLRQRHPAGTRAPRPKNPAWYGADAPGPLLDRIAADPEVERVIVLELRPGFPESSPSFALENGWQAPARESLRTDPRFERERETLFGGSGYVMTVYRRHGG